MRLLVLLAASAVVAACSLGLDSDEFASDPPLVPDASNEASVTDSASDSTTVDAGPDAFAGRWCADPARGAYIFCSDFDDGPLAKGWFDTEATFGGIQPEATLFRSAPVAARLTHQARDSGANGLVELNVVFALSGVLRIAFDARTESDIASPSQAPHQELAFVTMTDDPNSGCFLGPTNIECGPEGSQTSSALEQRPVFQTWHRWQLVLTRLATSVTCDVARDGVPVATVTGASTFGSAAKFHLGPGHIYANQEWNVLYDNVLVDEVK